MKRRSRTPALLAILWLGGLAPALFGSQEGATAPLPAFEPLDDASAFVARPYVQLGACPAPDRLTLVWHARSGSAQWQVEVGREGRWSKVVGITRRSVVVDRVVPHDVYEAELVDLPPGEPFAYRVLSDGTPVFAASAQAPKIASMAARFVVFGDSGAGTPEQASVANQVYRQRPDIVAIAGDVVYGGGRMSDYHQRFFPYYNARAPGPAVGAPLMRGTPFVAALGNHDVASHQQPLEPKHADPFGYFAYWAFPRNGPLAGTDSPSTPQLVGPPSIVQPLLSAFGDRYPRTANFSFDYGDAHWTVLDSNPYVDWTDPALRGWLEQDLQAARQKPWRFVLFHHPGVHSSTINDGQQQTQMRLVSDLFERNDVAVVFAGHYHHYQRSRPVRFALDQHAWRAANPWRARGGGPSRSLTSMTMVPGSFVIDRVFDGVRQATPKGVIYIVSGAGGAGLYEREFTGSPDRWQPFTQRFIANVHSFTVLDVRRHHVTLRQISAAGKELDRIVIRKASKS